MDKHMKYSWCSKFVMPVIGSTSNDYGKVKERRCPRCDAILAAYLEEEGGVLEKVRSFKD